MAGGIGLTQGIRYMTLASARLKTTGRLWSACIPFLLLFHHLAGWTLSPQDVYTVAAKSVAVLETLDEDADRIGTFSATQVDTRRFVTVCDALETAHSLRITRGAEAFKGQIADRDRERNLCFVDVAMPFGQPISAQTQAPATGSRVYAVSNALGLGVGISEGVVSGVRQFPNGSYIQFTAPISPGSQGGALVDDQGQLLGILDYRRRDGQNVNFASSVIWIQEVGPRAAASADQLKRFDAATALLKQKRWDELARHSADWLRSQPDQADALRFALAAAKGINNAEAELAGWRALRRAKPEDADMGLGLGMALIASGSADNIKEALVLARQLVAEHREYAEAHWLLARALQVSGLLQDAESSYRQSLTLDPWLTDAYQGLAQLAQARSDTATAISIWSRLSALLPDDPGLRFSLTQAYLSAGKASRAYLELENLGERDRDSAPAWYWRGVTLDALGSPDAAVQAYHKSLERQLAGADLAWAGIGFATMEMKRYPEAIAAFDTAHKINPADLRWRYLHAVNLKDGGRPVEALQIAMVLTEQAPQTSVYWRLRGLALGMLARHLEAIPAIERSLLLNAMQPSLWSALVLANQNLGRRQEALNAYQKLREIDANEAESTYRTVILPLEGAAP